MRHGTLYHQGTATPKAASRRLCQPSSDHITQAAPKAPNPINLLSHSPLVQASSFLFRWTKRKEKVKEKKEKKRI